MHMPSPWTAFPISNREFYSHEVVTKEGHVASIVKVAGNGQGAATAAANARLIENAPEMAAALRELLTWSHMMGGWDAHCWKNARTVLGQAIGAEEKAIAAASTPAYPRFATGEICQG